MTRLEMIKAFAELEGVNINYHRTTQTECGFWSDYNPFDYALNCKARDAYQVNVEHCTQLDCGVDGSGTFDIPFTHLFIKSLTGDFSVCTPLNDNSSEAICFAVIECILKSKGLWV